MLRTGHLLHPASTPASRPTAGASLPGTLASPRTGLSPAGSRELSLSSSPENSSSLDSPELSGRTPAQRTGGNLGDQTRLGPPATPSQTGHLFDHLALRTMNPKSECHETFMVRAKGNWGLSPVGSPQCLSFRPLGRRCDDTTMA